MSTKLINDSDKINWEQAVAQFPEANFLQSWNWGEFEQDLGKKILRLVWLDEQTGQIVALAQGVVETAKRGRYLAIAGGPLLDWQNQNIVTEVFTVLKNLAKKHRCWFIRFRPQAVLENQNQSQSNQQQSARLILPTINLSLLSQLGSHYAPMHLTADLSTQLDLTISNEDLLAQMRKNHRQSIRKVEKLNIQTWISTEASDLDQFYQEQLKLAHYHGFIPFSKTFLLKQFQAFVKDRQVALIHASIDHQLLASAFIIFYNREAVYHYGVSTELNKDYPGSYACQWRAIQEARSRGCYRYNLWGVSPKDQVHHRFAGVGLFKRGFGGQEINFLPAQDIIIDNRYYFTWVFEMIRKKLRKL